MGLRWFFFHKNCQNILICWLGEEWATTRRKGALSLPFLVNPTPIARPLAPISMAAMILCRTAGAAGSVGWVSFHCMFDIIITLPMVQKKLDSKSSMGLKQKFISPDEIVFWEKMHLLGEKEGAEPSGLNRLKKAGARPPLEGCQKPYLGMLTTLLWSSSHDNHKTGWQEERRWGGPRNLERKPEDHLIWLMLPLCCVPKIIQFRTNNT